VRVLIYGTSPLVGSGYASAVRYVSQGLKARGHDIAIYAWNSHAGQPLEWNGITVFPRANAINGSDGLSLFANHFKADVVLAICDPWVMTPENWKQGHEAKVVHWYPCQSHPASGILCRVVKDGSDASWCYSQWGTDVMRAAGVDSSYVPLGVDTDVFKPLDRDECRARFGEMLGRDLSGKFLVGMVAANSSTVPVSRKAFDQAFLAFKRFRETVTPDAVMYVHTWANAMQGGFDLQPMLTHLDLLSHVHFADPTWYLMGLPDSWMAGAYNAFDVALQATSAEGFGLPILEAQACGTPVITTNYSSMPELTKCGVSVDPAAMLWAPQPMDGWVAVPDHKQISQAMQDIYDGDHEDFREDGFDLARELSWPNIIDQYVIPELSRVVPSVESSAA
jgi:glycosyltransferase involved in cell wall biosynthesis